jgi:SSS family solute:Na+ symporter
MAILDIIIIVLYLAGMIWVGISFQRKASAGIDAYFLGERKLPWWVLGASGMASNLDVSGTMINTALIYAIGAQGFFIEIRGGIVLIMAFLMVYMGKWNRRAQVMTMAEWMELRFGSGRQGKIARLVSAIAILVSSVWIVTYFAFGAGIFITEFLQLPALFGVNPEFWAAALMIVLATLYTTVSGLYGVVWTDVFQGIFIFISITIVCTISITSYSIPETFSVSIPMRDGTVAALETTRNAWTEIIPSFTLNFPAESTYSGFNLFALAILFYLIKTIIDGSAGTGGYMIQRFYAARSDREAGLLSLFWIFLLSFRWPFIAAIAVMGIGMSANEGIILKDAETVLPAVINQVLPVGLRGLMIAGLISAAMSTFDSLINAAASYWVKDIYQAFINQFAPEQTLIRHSRGASVVIVLLGLFLTLNVASLNDIWSWLTMGLGAGLLIPLLLRWYWWRLNGYGFAAGTLAGMLAAFSQQLYLPEFVEYQTFLFISGISLLGLLAGTCFSRPTEAEVLQKFYRITRPFGFWGPVTRQLPRDEFERIRQETRGDRIAVLFAVPWQLVLFLLMMMPILGRWDRFGQLLAVFAVLSVGLYYFWYRRLDQK